jgi:hypothetical protein
VTQDAQDPSAYRISGLKAYQTQAGVYVRTAHGALIKDATGPAGSAKASASWALDRTGPTLRLFSAAPATATASDFRGAGRPYTFDLTPVRPGVTLTVSAAGASHAAAGNRSPTHSAPDQRRRC